MSNTPFDAFDGEQLDRDDPPEAEAAEEVAVHAEAVTTDDTRWSDLTEARADETTATYFTDEEPEVGAPHLRPDGEHVADLEELLETQHYSFPEEHKDH